MSAQVTQQRTSASSLAPAPTAGLSPLLTSIVSCFALAARHFAVVHPDRASIPVRPPPAQSCSASTAPTTVGSPRSPGDSPEVVAGRVGSSCNISPFWSSSAPDITVAQYCRRIAAYSGYGEIGVLMGLTLVARYCQAADELPADCTMQASPLTELTIHRLIIAAVAIASKANEDLFYQNAYLARVGGVQLRDFNELEAEFLRVTHYAVLISSDDLKMVCERCAAAGAGGDPGACLAAVYACGRSVTPLMPSLLRVRPSTVADYFPPMAPSSHH